MLAWSFILVLCQLFSSGLGTCVTTPASGVTPPATGTTPPAAGVTPPAAGVTPPAAGVTPPAAGVTPPAAGVTPPAAGGNLPPVSVTVLATVATVDASATIIYDAMDVFSRKFFSSVLANQMTAGSVLSSRVNITYIPCQTASFSNGDLSCTTPTDPKCHLNKVHACAIDQITDKTQLVNYLICTMKNTTPLPDYAGCANLNKVNDCEIQKCANSITGRDQCKAYSEKLEVGERDLLPRIIFKSPENIKRTDLFEYLDYFKSDLSVGQIQTALCALLKSKKVSTVPEECNQKLVVGIFYKAMNEKSQKWFRSMAQIYDTFANYTVLQYQPCMFAELTESGSLDCQDENDPDCLAGKTHACAAALLRDNPAGLFKFLSCATKNSSTLPNFQQCATQSNIVYDAIKTCANSRAGKTICWFSSKTRPKTTEVPSFSYELVFDEATSKKTADATELKTILCEQLKLYGISRPPVCNTC